MKVGLGSIFELKAMNAFNSTYEKIITYVLIKKSIIKIAYTIS